MSRSPRCLLAVLLLVVLTACGGSRDGQPLSITAEAGDTHAMRMRMEMGMEMTLGGQSFPSIELPVVAITTDMEVTEVTDEAIRMDYAYRDIELTGGQEETRAAMQQALGGMEDTTGHATVSHRGELLDASLDLPAAMDPTLTSMMEQLEQQFGQLSVPFPPEAVDVGDSWDHTTSLELSGITSTIEATYTLRSLDGDDYRIDVEMTQTVEPGPIEGPDGQVVGEIVEGSSTGTGSFEGSLSFPFPVRGRMSSSGTTRMLVTGGAEQTELVQDMSLEMRYQPVE